MIPVICSYQCYMLLTTTHLQQNKLLPHKETPASTFVFQCDQDHGEGRVTGRRCTKLQQNLHHQLQIDPFSVLWLSGNLLYFMQININIMDIMDTTQHNTTQRSTITSKTTQNTNKKKQAGAELCQAQLSTGIWLYCD